jgi:hypothetical protein
MGYGPRWLLVAEGSSHVQLAARLLWLRRVSPTLAAAVLILVSALPAQPASPATGPRAPIVFDLAAHERTRVVRLAEAALGVQPVSITAVVNPRSPGGPHDFSSEGDYWWPDPGNPDGPYVRRDGETNPANFAAHRRLMFAFARDVGALAAAFDLTHDERFAAAAADHLRVWFTDPATRMAPNLQYAQAIKGVCTGRATGLIDTVHLAEVALAVRALHGSRALDAATEAAVKDWFREYLHWLQTHPYGVEESRAENNHGTAWALQAAAFALLLDDERTLADCRRRFKEVLLPSQMGPDGSFPRELARTKAYAYSIFNLDVMTALAVLLSSPDEDLVRFRLPDGRGLLRGVEFLAPCIADKSKWPRPPDVRHWDEWPVRQPALLFGALARGRRDWLALWEGLPSDPAGEEIRRNYPIRFPTLWLHRPAVAAAPCAMPARVEAPGADGAVPTVLFVGNSFTFAHGSPVRFYRADTVTDLNGQGIGGVPALFKAFAAQAGCDYAVSLETAPGENLEFHVRARAGILARAWDIAVVQGYSTLDKQHPGDPAALVQSARELAELMRSRNPDVDVRLMATWSRADLTYRESGHWHGRPIERMALDVRAGYDLAAASSPSIHGVIPVGEAWNRAIRTGAADPDPYDGVAAGQVDLWTYDHYHASTYGCYLEALVVFGDLTGLDPRSLGMLEHAAFDLGLSPEQAVALQKVAFDELAARSDRPAPKTFEPVALAW